MFQGERKVAVDEALAKMEERHAQENDELRALNEKELKELEKQKLSPEELQQKRAQLLNQQQLRQSSRDKKQADERKQIQNGVLSDWEIRFARAKLELKEKHYQVFANCFSLSAVNLYSIPLCTDTAAILSSVVLEKILWVALTSFVLDSL